MNRPLTAVDGPVLECGGQSAAATPLWLTHQGPVTVRRVGLILLFALPTVCSILLAWANAVKQGNALCSFCFSTI